MFVILLAKFPPPTPAVAATMAISQNGVSGCVMKYDSPAVGISSSSAETMVQFRPPNFGTANVYGSRSVAPTRLGSATSQNSWSVEYPKPARGIETTTMLHSCHTEKPRNSAKIEGHRFRRAIARPFPAQNEESSGSQTSIQRPRRGASTVPTAPLPSPWPRVATAACRASSVIANLRSSDLTD
jgi:hypothetical protein